MATPYIPVSCDLYERLEECAVFNELCEITYRDEAGRVIKVHDRVVSLPFEDKVEYVLLQGGVKIRLDALLGLNGIPLPPTTYLQGET